jgi:hypothetical protein
MSLSSPPSGLAGRIQDLGPYGSEESGHQLEGFEEIGRAGFPTAFRHTSRNDVDVGCETGEGVVRLAVDLGYRTHRPAWRHGPRKHRLAHVRRRADAEVAGDFRELVSLAFR